MNFSCETDNFFLISVFFFFFNFFWNYVRITLIKCQFVILLKRWEFFEHTINLKFSRRNEWWIILNCMTLFDVMRIINTVFGEYIVPAIWQFNLSMETVALHVKHYCYFQKHSLDVLSTISDSKLTFRDMFPSNILFRRIVIIKIRFCVIFLLKSIGIHLISNLEHSETSCRSQASVEVIRCAKTNKINETPSNVKLWKANSQIF